MSYRWGLADEHNKGFITASCRRSRVSSSCGSFVFFEGLSQAVDQQGQVQAIARPGLFVDGGQMGLDGSLGNIEIGGDFQIGLPLATSSAILRSVLVRPDILSSDSCSETVSFTRL